MERFSAAVRVREQGSSTQQIMSQQIDVLIVDPSGEDAARTAAAIRQKVPNAITAHMPTATEAQALLFGVPSPKTRLIIIDVIATGESGKEMLRRLRSVESTRSIPVIIFSASRGPSDLLQSYLLGAQMNMMKPTEPDEYAKQVERAMTGWYGKVLA
jgi:DNA-binding NarL/FixJ family response regulator